MRNHLLKSRKVGEVGRREPKGVAGISVLAVQTLAHPPTPAGTGGIRVSGLQVNSEDLSLLGWWKRTALGFEGGLGRRAREGGEEGSPRVRQPVFQSGLQP